MNTRGLPPPTPRQAAAIAPGAGNINYPYAPAQMAAAGQPPEYGGPPRTTAAWGNVGGGYPPAVATPPQGGPWQPAAAANPWGAYDRTPGFTGFGGGGTNFGINPEVETLRASRRRAWLIALVVLVGAGTGGWWAYKDRERLVRDAAQHQGIEKTHKEALARIEKQTADIAALEAKAKDLEQKAAAGGVAIIAPAAREASAKLAEDLKKLLAGSKDITIEARDERVVVTVADRELFSGSQAEIGLDGFRFLYRFGKALKAVKDRQVLVTGLAGERKKLRGERYPTTWDLSAARAVSVARFMVDDLGMDAKRVSTSSPAPQKASRKGGGHGQKLEIALSPIPPEPAAPRS